MKKNTWKIYSTIMSLALVFGLTACAPKDDTLSSGTQPGNSGNNLSDRSINAEYREGGLNVGMIVLPTSHKNSRPYWNYNLDSHGMSGAQILSTDERIIAVKSLESEGQYRIVVIDTVSGQTILDSQTPAYTEFNKAIITRFDDRPYLNIVSTGISQPSDALSKGEGQAILTYVDLSAEKPTILQTQTRLGGLHPTVEKSSTISDNFSNYTYAKSEIGHEKYAFAYPLGNSLISVEPTDNNYSFEPEAIIENELLYKRSGGYVSDDIMSIGESVDVYQTTGNRNATQIFWAEEQFLLVGSISHSELYLIDTTTNKVIVNISRNTFTDGKEIESMESFGVSKNREYVVFGSFAVDVKRGKYMDMSESDTRQAVTLTHVNDRGIAYGKALEGSAAVTLDIPNATVESNIGDTTQSFGYVRDSFDNGSLLVETDSELFVVTVD